MTNRFEDISDILERCRRIAAVGLKSDYDYDVVEFLSSEGYDIIPVGPAPRKVHHLKTAKHFPQGGADLAAFFSGSGGLLQWVDEAARAGIDVVWFQRGVRVREAAQHAAHLGLQVVTGRCLRAEYLVRWVPVSTWYTPENPF
jgi:predicted CoA-binding protein